MLWGVCETCGRAKAWYAFGAVAHPPVIHTSLTGAEKAFVDVWGPHFGVRYKLAGCTVTVAVSADESCATTNKSNKHPGGQRTVPGTGLERLGPKSQVAGGLLTTTCHLVSKEGALGKRRKCWQALLVWERSWKGRGLSAPGVEGS